MELVYLWVEKYKNIHEQGFNFSPRFDCQYKNNELTIIEKKEDEYIKDFFGDNINVTAIVGKNGSGKSSILKVIHLLENKDYGFAIFKDENNTFYLEGNQPYECLKDYKKLYGHELTGFFLFDYSFTYDDEISYNEFVFPKKQIGELKGVIDFKDEVRKNQKNILENYFDLKEENLLDNFNNFFQPNTIEIYFDLNTIKAPSDLKLSKNSDKKLNSLKAKIKKGLSFEEFVNTLNEIQELMQNKESYNPEQFGIFKKSFMPNMFPLGRNDDQGDEYNNIWKKSYPVDDDVKEFKKEYKETKLIQKNKSTKYQVLKCEINEIKKYVNIILSSFSSEHFTIELIDKNAKKLSDLSFGEQQLLFILNQLYSLRSVNIEEQNTGQQHTIDNLIILLDEIDIGFHPDWQKRTLQYIIDFLKLIPNKQFHLIFTTHSPFLLSDIPKDNIVFLNDKPPLTQTFGANIHTLLSDSFFMEDGLMGEFAKNKIRTIKVAHRYVLHRHKRKTLFTQSSKRSRRLLIKRLPKFWQIQEIIGEPFLQKIIKNQLEEMELILLGKAEAIDNEIARLVALKKNLKNA